MSLAGVAIGEAAIAAQTASSTSTKTSTPKNRTIVANSDVVAQPEPR